MDKELARLTRHPFFRQIGQFKGFSQDSLVMKRARGYSDIYRNWLLLQCGYELEDGICKLEVQDVSELYEIWCFIKVKNMVQSIEGDDSKLKTKSGDDLLLELLNLLTTQFGENGNSISIQKLTEMNDILVRDHFVSFWG